MVTHLAIFSPKKSGQQDAMAKILPFCLPTLEDFASPCPSGMSQGGAVVLRLSTLSITCILHTTICKPGLRLLFLCQPIVGSSPRDHRCRLGERKWCSKWGPGHLGHFFMQFAYAFRACLVLILYIPLPFDDGVFVHTQLRGWVAHITPRSNVCQVSGYPLAQLTHQINPSQ